MTNTKFQKIETLKNKISTLYELLNKNNIDSCKTLYVRNATQDTDTYYMLDDLECSVLYSLLENKLKQLEKEFDEM